MPPRYAAWLRYVFERPVTPNGWYFDLDEPDFEGSEAEIAELVAYTLENCGRDLAGYSEEQVYHGLNYIFSNACSNTVFALMDDIVPVALRLRAIAAIKLLYRDCFAPRCAPVLGCLDEPGGNRLNSICYMLWDMSPLGHWEGRPNKEVFYSAVVGVMEEALASSNPACVESALHGLGHAQPYFSARVVEVIAAYQRRNVYVSPRLKDYAQYARNGCVQ
ncbi:MAG: hypothetical protein HZB95_01885 [Nitrosomonadales bacterium]|nr:hypothetical protein [Nitrosomonadales bacterium]